MTAGSAGAASNPLRAVAGLPSLEKYELLEEIGHGGMATVYRARDPRLGRDVAVKVIHRHLRENAEVGTRFVAEARASAKLRHPGIVDVYDVSEEDDPERYLVAELVRGTTLRKVLLAHRDMPAEVGAAIVQRLCDAVEHAHESAIIHRDIKPENVLVELPADRAAAKPVAKDDAEAESASADHRVGEDTGVRAIASPGTPESRPDPTSAPSSAPTSQPDSGDTQSSPRDVVTPRAGPQRSRAAQRSSQRAPVAPVTPRPRPVDVGVVIKITDFGIAKILDAQSVTSTGQVLGSPAHMAPEQIEGGEVDARTDVFALGVLLYECLVGHLPFEGKNPAQVLRRVLDGDYSPADRERPTVGGRWARVIADALAKDPNERIASAAELAGRIGEELSALGITDGQVEVCAYFADPAAYIAAHKAKLVPKLTARGEAARAAGDARGAAADWNRALALAPDDLAILKRMASLTSSASRRVLLRRVSVIVAGSAMLGVGAFEIARAVKGHPVQDDGGRGTAGLPSATPSASPAGDDSGTPTAAPRPTVSAGARVASIDAPARGGRIPLAPGIIPAGAVSGADRPVQFVFVPQGVNSWTLDGTPQSTWAGREFRLRPGTHQIDAAPPDPACCSRLSKSVRVDPLPPGEPETAQTIPLLFELNPAHVTLATSAPHGATLVCPSFVALPGTPTQVAAKRVDDVIRCTFNLPGDPPRSTSVRITAGKTTSVVWPDK